MPQSRVACDVCLWFEPILGDVFGLCPATDQEQQQRTRGLDFSTRRKHIKETRLSAAVSANIKQSRSRRLGLVRSLAASS